MNWFYFSLLSIFALSVAELTQQFLFKNKNEAVNQKLSIVFTFLFQAFLSFFIILSFNLTDQLTSVFSIEIFPKMLFVSFIGSFGAVFYFKSLNAKNISISLIFVSLSVVASTFLGILIFKESVDVLKFIGIILVIFAVVLVNLKNPILEKNHFFGLLAGPIFGICYFLDKLVITQDIHPLIYIFWTFPLTAFFSFLFNFKEVAKAFKKTSFNAYKFIALSALGYFFYNFFTFIAYTLGGEVGKIDTINNSQVFIVILFEFFILKNTKGLVRKILSAIIAVIGVLLLGVE